MQVVPTPESSPERRSLNVLISSPFCEPAGERWSLREELRRRLREFGHKPWLYEIDAKRHIRTGLTPGEIIIEAIKRSDVVITLYKSRAGSFLADEPFFATAFETFHARRLSKTVYLHVLGRSCKPRLRGVLSVFEAPLVLPDQVKRHESERELVTAVLSDVNDYVANRLSHDHRSVLLPQDSVDLVNGWDWLGGTHTNLLRAQQAENLWEARRTAIDVPLLSGAVDISREKKFTYATLLSACANVLANQCEYDRSAQCCWLAIRLFMELGYPYEMLAQIQAVSGILNMANHVRRAYWTNTFGLQCASKLKTKQYQSLRPAFNDSRGSILRKLGKFASARERLRESLTAVGDGSPYSLAKYAITLAGFGATANIDAAVRIIYEQALPLSASQGRSIAYVKRHAAGLAIIVGDYVTAARLLAEAEQSCKKKGQLHTLAAIKRMKFHFTLGTASAWVGD